MRLRKFNKLKVDKLDHLYMQAVSGGNFEWKI